MKRSSQGSPPGEVVGLGALAVMDRVLWRAAAAYAALVFAVTPFAFLVVFPLATRWVDADVTAGGWAHAFASRLPQYAVYALSCGLFYWVLARPAGLCPVLPAVRSTRRSVVAAGCMLAALRLLTPLGVLLTPNAVGLLTFMLTGVSEEWIFRGLLTRALADRAGMWRATAVVSAAFALWHWAEIAFVDRRQLLSAGWFAAVGADFAFAVVFTVIVWRSRSILWGGLVHGLGDWKPWLYDHAFWINARHVPAAVLIYAAGLAGAEITRRGAPGGVLAPERQGAVGA